MACHFFLASRERCRTFSIRFNDSIGNQYVLTYTPTNAKQDGSYRKIRVELVDNEGQPLKMQDEKHHPMKYDVIARDGYKAKQQVD